MAPVVVDDWEKPATKAVLLVEVNISNSCLFNLVRWTITWSPAEKMTLVRISESSSIHSDGIIMDTRRITATCTSIYLIGSSFLNCSDIITLTHTTEALLLWQPTAAIFRLLHQLMVLRVLWHLLSCLLLRHLSSFRWSRSNSVQVLQLHVIFILEIVLKGGLLHRLSHSSSFDLHNCCSDSAGHMHDSHCIVQTCTIDKTSSRNQDTGNFRLQSQHVKSNSLPSFLLTLTDFAIKLTSYIALLKMGNLT